MGTEHTNIDWSRRALDFITALYRVKEKRAVSDIESATTALLAEWALADGAALVWLEDELTSRIVSSSPPEFLKSFAWADLVGRITDSEKVLITHNKTLGGDQKYHTLAYLPIDNLGFRGGFTVCWKQEPPNRAQLVSSFLTHAWAAVKDTLALSQRIYETDELSARFNAILETIPQGVVFVDDKGKHGWVNGKAAEILGVKREKNAPVEIAQAMQQLRNRAVNQEEIMAEAAKLFASPNRKVRDWRWIFGKPATNVLSVSCTPTQSENATGRLWVFTDVTFQHLANEELKELNIELAEKRKIADEQNKAKSDFLANMSHEIRTPMNGVIGMTSLLSGTPLSEEQKDFVETIRISGETLLSLINDILDFSKIESGKLELDMHPFRLDTIIEDAYDLLSQKANEKGLDLLYMIEPEVPAELIGDATRIRQILINLVSNGVKFTEKGELLTTVKTLEKNGESYLIEFTVKDTGIGIPEDKYHRLFQSFSQVDSSTTRRYGGTGLGLAICQRLTQLMGGTIRVESEPGKGSSFIFTIEAKAHRQVKQYANNVKTLPADLRGKKVLILDDNKTNLKILKTQCGMWGMQTAVFDSYPEALKAIESEHFDIAFVDMVMPVKDGIDVTRMIKERFPLKQLPIVLFSSSGYFPQADTDSRSLFAAVLNKPAKLSQIQRTIAQVLGNNDSAAGTPRQQKAEDANALPIQILVAEDNEINQKLIKKALLKLGYDADLVLNGKEAVAAAKQKQYHLIFMDVMMPEMDGYEATREIVKLRQSIRPIIFAMTANALAGDYEKAMASGMDDYISKPFRVQDVKDKLDKWAAELTQKAGS